MRKHNYTFMLKKIEKIPLLCLLTWLYNKPSMAQTTPDTNKFFIVPKVFEPLKFDCICGFVGIKKKMIAKLFYIAEFIRSGHVQVFSLYFMLWFY